jgi:hypothetical protein
MVLMIASCTVNAPTSNAPPSPSASPSAAVPAVPANTAGQPTDSLDTTIVPGDHVGPITATTSYQDLRDQFGAAALTDTEVAVGEGFFEPGTALDLGEGRSLSILWEDDARTRPAEIRNIGAAWKLAEGIGLGTSFADLESALGAFELSGFGWDYGGTLSLEGTALDAYSDVLVLRVQPDPTAIESAKPQFEAVLGEDMISHDNPNLPPLKLTVTDMIVYLTPAE